MIIGIPTEQHLSRLYYELALHGARSVGQKVAWPYKYSSKEELLLLASDLSRFDPRLLEVIVGWIFDQWQTFNPSLLRQLFFKMKMPQTFLVAANFLVNQISNPEYFYFYNYLSQNLNPVSPQLYFCQIYTNPAGSLMAKAVMENVQAYDDWGFLARERPTLMVGEQRILLGSWSIKARQRLLTQLSQSGTPFSVSDYLEKLEYSLTRQQALADLKSFSGLHLKGKGRGSVWHVRGKK